MPPSLILENAAYRAAAAIVARLRAHGHAAYFAGGCVRDLLLGHTPNDFDIATSATPDQVTALFEKTFTVGAHFGVVLVMQNDIRTEVATFRDDGAYTDGRHPDAVRFSSVPSEDAKRRDFTINGMFLDPEKLSDSSDIHHAVLDFVGGQNDLRDGLIRAIGNPDQRFAEDKLRMLRAVRFAARLGFQIHSATADSIDRFAHEVHQVSQERLRNELTLILTEGHARQGFEMLYKHNLLAELLPEVVRLRGVEQPPQFHPEGDVWTHTMLMLEGLDSGSNATLAWGVLLHDIGKPATFRRPDPSVPGDRIRFNGHVEAGIAIAQAICRRLRFSISETEQIVALVANHMRFGSVREMKQSTLKRFLRLPRFEEHLALHRLDCLASHRDLALYEFARTQFESIPPDVVRPALLVTGRDLIAAGYRPGSQFKTMLAAAEDAQLEGLIQSTEEGLHLLTEQFGPAPTSTQQ
jgi:poly(A) polymerase